MESSQLSLLCIHTAEWKFSMLHNNNNRTQHNIKVLNNENENNISNFPSVCLQDLQGHKESEENVERKAIQAMPEAQ